MNRILIFFAIVALCISVYGCQQKKDGTGMPVFELEASNASDVLIYPVVSSDTSRQRFGVLGVNSSKVYGFSPFRVGDSITITWSEGESEELYKKVVNTAPLAEQVDGIYTLNFVYVGNQIWEVRVLDKGGNELKKISQ